tara:strand:- start:10034 stop:10435 length:402 start_codon:yes stop_codon:yes gene_type:complete
MEIKMNAAEIHTAMKAIEATISDKGYYAPCASFKVNWVGYDLTIHLEYKSSSWANVKSEFIHAKIEDGIEGIIAEAVKHVSEIASIEDQKRNDFITAMGRLIDQGRDIGMEVEFMNPLTEMMGKLSTNIITKE